MSSDEIIKVNKSELNQLIKNKLFVAGLPEDHAEVVAEHLSYADARGIHSHGCVRVEYYAERISKGGSNINPIFTFEKTGPSCGIYDGDNAVGMVVALNGMKEAISLAKETGIGVVGMKRMGHCGTLSYFLRMAAEEDLVAISFCQSDPMVVPYGGSEPYFGTNPIGFAAPQKNGDPIIFDMATTVQAWGKVLEARAKNKSIPPDWAVNENGEPTTDPYKVSGLLPISGPKGYGLMMMIDILSGTLLGLPFGKHVSSMYSDLSKGRELGQMHIVINPKNFTDLETFKENISQMVSELNNSKPAVGFEKVNYPGENYDDIEKEYEKNGIPIVKEIYDYLKSDIVHSDKFNNGSAFASK